MNNVKKLLFLALVLGIVLVGVRLFRPSEFGFPDTENVSNNPASKVCLKISQPGDVYHCLAVVNQDSSFCAKVGSGEDKNVCLALSNKDLSFCRKIKESEAKKICYYELSFAVDRIDYCDELEDWEKCYFSFIYRLYWRDRPDEIETGYCQKFSANAGGDLAFKDTCFALRERNSSLCRGNQHCLSFFEQPISFCENIKLKTEADCLRDRALTAKDSSLCERIDDENIRDNCYASYSAHISPDLVLCEKIIDKMTKNMCYAEYAINLSRD